MTRSTRRGNRPANHVALTAEAKATVAALTDGRVLSALDMLKLGHARRTLAQLS